MTWHDSMLANTAMFNYSGAKDRMTGEYLASYYGPERKQFIAGNTAPGYMKGEVAGDFGYDILTLSALRRTVRLRSCMAAGPCLALLARLPLRP